MSLPREPTFGTVCSKCCITWISHLWSIETNPILIICWVNMKYSLIYWFIPRGLVLFFCSLSASNQYVRYFSNVREFHNIVSMEWQQTNHFDTHTRNVKQKFSSKSLVFLCLVPHRMKILLLGVFVWIFTSSTLSRMPAFIRNGSVPQNIYARTHSNATSLREVSRRMIIANTLIQIQNFQWWVGVRVSACVYTYYFSSPFIGALQSLLTLARL